MRKIMRTPFLSYRLTRALAALSRALQANTCSGIDALSAFVRRRTPVRSASACAVFCNHEGHQTVPAGMAPHAPSRMSIAPRKKPLGLRFQDQ